MPKALAKLVLAAATLLAAVGCGYDTSATFNSDGSVTIGLKLLFPKELLQGSAGPTISGFSASDLAAANASLQSKYPGGKVTLVNEGDESGAVVTIPFKTEKDAFAFLTSPSQLTPSGATSGSGVNLNLSNTGGLFTSATHVTTGQVDTYTFQTSPQPMPTPSPGQQQVISNQEIASIFAITFSLTLPREITSAPGALFTLDRKTAIWKLSWTKAETLTATTGQEPGLVASVVPAGRDSRQVIAVGVVAIVIAFLLGMLMPWRILRRPAPQPAVQSAGEGAVTTLAAPELPPDDPPPDTSTPV